MSNNQKKYSLPKEFAKKWLNALCSNKYKQAKNALYDSTIDGYCCLGVACVLDNPLESILYKPRDREREEYNFECTYITILR